MKYIVITSKHHDGFALFKSKASRYNVVDATPFKRDMLKELAEACAKQGIRLGFYYSQSQDWHEPNGAGNDWDFGPDVRWQGAQTYDEYLREQSGAAGARAAHRLRPGRADLVRHAAHDDGERAAALHRHRAHAPAQHADRRPARRGRRLRSAPATTSSRPTSQAEAWEVPATINHTWGYRKDDTTGSRRATSYSSSWTS